MSEETKGIASMGSEHKCDACGKVFAQDGPRPCEKGGYCKGDLPKTVVSPSDDQLMEGRFNEWFRVTWVPYPITLTMQNIAHSAWEKAWRMRSAELANLRQEMELRKVTLAHDYDVQEQFLAECGAPLCPTHNKLCAAHAFPWIIERVKRAETAAPQQSPAQEHTASKGGPCPRTKAALVAAREENERLRAELAEALKRADHFLKSGNALYKRVVEAAEPFHPDKNNRAFEWDVMPQGVTEALQYWMERADAYKAALIEYGEHGLDDGGVLELKTLARDMGCA